MNWHMNHKIYLVMNKCYKNLSIVISNLDCDLIGNLLLKTCSKTDENLTDFIYWNPESDLKSLILDLCTQMILGENNEKMNEEIVKFFIYVKSYTDSNNNRWRIIHD